MQITVQTPIGSTIKLDVEASDPIDSIKAKIHDKGYTISPSVQLMTNLEGERTLKDYNIQNGFTLHLVRTSFNIVIKPRVGKRFNLDVEASDTIAIVKAKIQAESATAWLKDGVPPHLQRLRFAHMELKDERSLAEVGIKGYDTVYFSWSDVELEIHMNRLS
jgi:hypothetical protein